MMIDAVMVMLVLAVTVVIVSLIATRQPRELRPYFGLALAEYAVCCIAQQVYSRVIVGGGDEVYYARSGAALAKFLGKNFPWASRELLMLLLQQPSAFDKLVEGTGTNTASMTAVSAFMQYFLGGSEFAASALISSFALLGSIAIFKAFQAAYPIASPIRMFIATVLFPSVAFWTCALHKESFCLIGIGLVCACWRAVNERRVIGALVTGALGGYLILLFRPPALPPLLLGFATYMVVDRMQKAKGAGVVLFGPLYFIGALVALAGGMVMLTRFSPKFGVERLGDTMTAMQQGWALSKHKAGSDFVHIDDVPAPTIGSQLLHVPLALLNALFRPTIFDVHNLGSAVSAIEMTIMMYLVYRAVRRRGLGRTLAAIQRSPFLLMVTVVTMVGCTFVGLVTLNMGSLARYRVPFLPFYGALVVCLAARRAEEDEPESEPEVLPLRAPAEAPRLSREDRLRRAREPARR